MDDPVPDQALANDGVDLLANLMARRHEPGVCARLGRERQPARGGGAARLSGFTSATLEPNFSKARFTSPARVASTAAFRSGSRWRMISFMVAVFMPAAWSCAKGFPGVDGVELFRVADENDPGQSQYARDPQEFAHLARGGQGALVHDESGLPVARAQVFLGASREAALCDVRVSREEALERLALDPRFRFERPRGRGRGR